MMEAPNLREYVYGQGEEFILANLLQNSHVDDIVTHLPPDTIHDPCTKKVVEICMDYAMTTGKGSVDYRAIVETLGMLGKGSPDTLDYLNSLYTIDLRQAPAVDYMIESIRNMSSRRKLLWSLYQNLQKATNKNSDISKMLSDLEEDLANIDTSKKEALEVITANEVWARRKKGIIARMQAKPIFSGWPGFNKHLSVGFAPKKLSVIAGRTSMGKSFFKTNLMISMAQEKIGVVNICPEQGFDSEHDRIDAVMTGIHLKAFSRLAELEPTDPKFGMIKQQSERISVDWNYACVPTRGITVAGVRAAIRRARRAGCTPNIVFIDLFDRLDDVNVAKERTATMSRKLGEIEKIADEEDVHICLLVQVNRGPEGKKDHRPTIADLKDCGSFEQDADVIFLLYREGYYNRDIPDDMLDVEIAKQRDGAAGVVFQFLITDKETLAIAPIGEKKFASQQADGSHK